MKTIWLLGIMFATVFALDSSLFGQESWIHPDAVLQPTAVGKRIREVEAINGKIYMGYGDYSANTGPIEIRYFDPVTDQISNSLLTTNSEAIFRYKEIGGTIFALHADPIGGNPGGYAFGPSDHAGAWSDNNNLSGIVHGYDIESFGSSSNLFITGSGGGHNGKNSRVWNSPDGGQTWNVAVDEMPVGEWSYTGPGDTTDGYSRFYGAGMLDGNLWINHITFQYEGDGNGNLLNYLGREVHSAYYDGVNLIPGPEFIDSEGELNLFVDPETFADHLVSRNGHSGSWPSKLFTFDGTTTDFVQMDDGVGGFHRFHDYTVDGDLLYVLRDDKMVMSTADLLNWDFVVQASTDAFSLAILGRDVYLGGRDGVLYRYQNAVVPEPSSAVLLLAGLTLLTARRRRPARKMF